MPRYSVSVDITAPIERIFAEVADLTRHPAWAADPLEITAVDGDSAAPVTVGRKYRSSVVAKGKTITADLEVTAYEPPDRFGFSVVDLTGHYVHDFRLQRPKDGPVRVERTVDATLGLAERLLFLVVFRLVKLPNSRLALRRLKQRCEVAG